jgi:hypothetical protein
MVMYLLFSTRFLLINFVEYIAERMTGDKRLGRWLWGDSETVV